MAKLVNIAALELTRIDQRQPKNEPLVFDYGPVSRGCAIAKRGGRWSVDLNKKT